MGIDSSGIEKHYQGQDLPENGLDNSDYDLIKLNSGFSPLDTILRSGVFRQRVRAMTKRVVETRAESSINSYLEGKNIYLSHLSYGTRFAEGAEDLAFGMSGASAAVQDQHIFIPSYNEYFQKLGSFHIHPRKSGFSQTDINAFEEDIMHPYGAVLDKDMLIPGILVDRFTGLFFPEMDQGHLKNLNLAVISGSPTSNYYQAYDFSQTSMTSQFEILQQSGFSVAVYQLPVAARNQIDFSSLKRE